MLDKTEYQGCQKLLTKGFFSMKLICNVILLLFTIGCSTNYKPEGFSGGYSETQISKKTYIVRYKCNGYTSQDKCQNLLLLHAADITLQQEYKFFEIISFEDNSRSFQHVTPVVANTNMQINTYGNTTYGTARTDISGGNIYNIHKPSFAITIRLLKEEKNSSTLNAELIKTNMVAKYRIKDKTDTNGLVNGRPKGILRR